MKPQIVITQVAPLTEDIVTTSDLLVYVLYTGATDDLDLGAK